MPEMVLNRNFDLASVLGRVVNFKKGVPVWVNPELVKEAQAIGAEFADGSKKDILDPEEPEVPELTPDQREEKLLEVFPKLEASNKREDFTGQGIPAVPALNALLEFEVTAKERDAAWTKYQQIKSDALKNAE